MTTTTKNVNGVVSTETHPADPKEGEGIVQELKEAIEPLLNSISFTLPRLPWEMEGVEAERLAEGAKGGEGKGTEGVRATTEQEGATKEGVTEAGSAETESEQYVRADRGETDPLGHTITIRFHSETFVVGKPGEEGAEGKEQ